MMLKKMEVCKYSSTCPYNSGTGQDFCVGATANRPTEFNCSKISDTGVFIEGSFRSKHDVTGQMKVIMENK